MNTLTWIDFFNSFWPNFISSLLSLVLGLPCAFWINRRTTHSARNDEAKENKSKLLNSILVLQDVLSSNKINLENIKTDFEQNKNAEYPIYQSILDYSAWDSLKKEIIEHLDNPSLRHKLGYHFYRIEQVKQLIDRRNNYCTGLAVYIDSSLIKEITNLIKIEITKELGTIDQIIIEVNREKVNLL